MGPVSPWIPCRPWGPVGPVISGFSIVTMAEPGVTMISSVEDSKITLSSYLTEALPVGPITVNRNSPGSNTPVGPVAPVGPIEPVSP